MSDYLDAGDLIHRITIQYRTVDKDEFAGDVETWHDLDDYWAFVRSANAREQVIAEQLQAQVTHSITMRHQGTTVIEPTMRAIYEGKTLNFASVLNRDNRNFAYDILACQSVP